MMTRKEKFQLRQLDRFFENGIGTFYHKAPPRGWLREMRKALRINMHEMADKMHVSRQRITILERNENCGKLTLDTMKRAADALDCEFLYYVVPKQRRRLKNDDGAISRVLFSNLTKREAIIPLDSPLLMSSSDSPARSNEQS